MVFKIGTLLEKGRFNWKGVNKILHNHESRIDALEGKTDSDTVYDDTEIKADISALETTVGDANSGLVKDTSALKTTVGDADGGLVKSVADINTAIGDVSTEGTILARIKALEDAQTPGGD